MKCKVILSFIYPDLHHLWTSLFPAATASDLSIGSRGGNILAKQRQRLLCCLLCGSNSPSPSVITASSLPFFVFLLSEPARWQERGGGLEPTGRQQKGCTWSLPVYCTYVYVLLLCLKHDYNSAVNKPQMICLYLPISHLSLSSNLLISFFVCKSPESSCSFCKSHISLSFLPISLSVNLLSSLTIG